MNAIIIVAHSIPLACPWEVFFSSFMLFTSLLQIARVKRDRICFFSYFAWRLFTKSIIKWHHIYFINYILILCRTDLLKSIRYCMEIITGNQEQTIDALIETQQKQQKYKMSIRKQKDLWNTRFMEPTHIHVICKHTFWYLVRKWFKIQAPKRENNRRKITIIQSWLMFIIALRFKKLRFHRTEL